MHSYQPATADCFGAVTRSSSAMPSNCSGAVSACQLFWPGLYQPAGNKKKDEYEDEEEVEEVEEEGGEHEDEYEDERVKTMTTMLMRMAIVFGAFW